MHVEKGWCLWAHSGCPPTRALLVLLMRLGASILWEGRRRRRRWRLPGGWLQAAILGALLLQVGALKPKFNVRSMVNH